MAKKKVQTAAALSLVVLGAALATSACTGASSPTGECLSYSCDEDGAKAMMWATVDAAYTPSERAKTALDQAIEKAVNRMKQEQGFTPQTFELARGNMKKFLDEVPEQGEDPLGPAAEELVQGTTKLCPLWPFC